LGSVASLAGSDLTKRSRTSPGADDLAIRFVNTAAWRLRDRIEERMASPEAFLAWLQQNRIGDANHLEQLLLSWRRQPDAAQAVLRDAIGLREAIYAILTSRIKRTEPPRDALLCFNGFLCRPTPGLQITWQAGELIWLPQPGHTDPTDLLMPVACSAAELMTGTRAGKVRQCEDDRGCGWLFVDESRTQNRRWCSMGDCGNRAKAQRHYQRARGPAAH
jgi:predicted RNA-binding Zn ribbon-like protein